MEMSLLAIDSSMIYFIQRVWAIKQLLEILLVFTIKSQNFYISHRISLKVLLSKRRTFSKLLMKINLVHDLFQEWKRFTKLLSEIQTMLIEISRQESFRQGLIMLISLHLVLESSSMISITIRQIVIKLIRQFKNTAVSMGDLFKSLKMLKRN
jgi:hypothetical protein